MLKTENRKYKNQDFINYKFSLSNSLITHLGCLEEETSKNIPILKFVSNHGFFQKPLNVCNPIFTMLKYKDTTLHPNFIKPKNHYQKLDLDDNVLYRETSFVLEEINITINSEKFLDLENAIIYHSYKFKADKNIELDFYQGIENVSYHQQLKISKITSRNHEKQILGLTDENQKINHLMIYQKNFRHKNRNKSDQSVEHYIINAEANKEYSIIHYAGIFTENEKKFRKLLKKQRNKGYDIIFKNHKSAWLKEFDKYKINIFNNHKVELLANYSIFQMLSRTPNDKDLFDKDFSYYKWFNDAFVIRFYLNNKPDLARKIIKQRIESLVFAKKIAEANHYKGALYLDDINAFNSGFRQLYLNGILAYSLDLYYRKTQDISILSDGGLLMLIEICHFYASYAKLNDKKTRYDILNVSNIDNTIQNIDNHTLTNYLIKHCFKLLHHYTLLYKKQHLSQYQNIIRYHRLSDALNEIRKVNKKLYLRKENNQYLIQNYQGFFEDLKSNHLINEDGKLNFTNDVLLMFSLFPEEFSEHIKQKNKHFHQENFVNNDFNKVFCALVATNEVDEYDYDCFLETINLESNGIYINNRGINRGLSGIIYYYLVYHLAKLRLYNNVLTTDSLLPQAIRRLEFSIVHLKNIAEIKIKRNSARIEWNKN